MARCKANVTSSILDPPPPYTYYEVDQHVIGDSMNNPSRLNSCRNLPSNAQIRTLTNAQARKVITCHYCSYFLGCVIAIIICFFVTVTVFPYPLQASCTIKWKFGEPCKFVMQRLRCQILKWTSCDDCGHRGNKCLYSLKEAKSRENNTIRATHLSTNLQLVDDIKIEFDENLNDSCVSTAKSVSRSWFMVFDYGTNYCNLRNLVEGVGLHMDRGFDESTNDTVCTQRSTALCT